MKRNNSHLYNSLAASRGGFTAPGRLSQICCWSVVLLPLVGRPSTPSDCWSVVGLAAGRSSFYSWLVVLQAAGRSSFRQLVGFVGLAAGRSSRGRWHLVSPECIN
jgi:hypothetical protein